MPAGADDARIDSLFRDCDYPDTPGASVLVVKDGAVLYERGYGLADVEDRCPIGPTTNFRLASLTKQFTAMAIMILKEQGLLTYEQSLGDLIPDFPSYGRTVKIRHLLNHTSGLHDYENLIPDTRQGQLNDQDVIDILKRECTTYFAPGSQYRYGNSSYEIGRAHV